MPLLVYNPERHCKSKRKDSQAFRLCDLSDPRSRQSSRPQAKRHRSGVRPRLSELPWASEGGAPNEKTAPQSMFFCTPRSKMANGDLGSPSLALMGPVGQPLAQRFTDRGQYAIMRSHHFMLA
jgi:hypothetical protein